MSPLQKRCLKRSFLAEELYQTWKLSHDRWMTACEIDEISSECVELCHLLARAWKARDAEFFSNGMGVLERETAILDLATDKVANVIVQLLVDVAKSKATAPGCGCSELLASELDDLRERQKKSPRFDPSSPEIRAMIEQSEADFARGDYLTLDELVHAS